VRLEGLGKLKKIHLIWTRTRDLPAYNVVPLPTTLPNAPLIAYDLGFRESFSIVSEDIRFAIFRVSNPNLEDGNYSVYRNLGRLFKHFA
jgi:hypothetical protein